FYVAPRIALRIGAGARAGEVPPAQASSLAIFGALGASWDIPWRPAPALSFGLRADALVVRHQLAHLDSDDPTTVTQVVWMPGADSIFTAFYDLSQGAAVFLGVGAEGMFGTSDIYVGNVRTAEVPILRAVAELGAAARF